MKGSLIKNFLIFFFIFLFIASFFSLFNSSSTQTTKTDITGIINDLNHQNVKSIVVDGNQLLITLKDGSEKTAQKEPNDTLSSIIKDYNIDPSLLKDVSISVKGESTSTFWLNTLLPFIIPFLLIAVFIWIMMRQIQGANNRALGFGQSSARMTNQKDNKNRVTFSDVAGAEEAKIELTEVVEFLKNPQKFLALGAKIPKGVLLLGAPGTGKTLLAKAVAGEARVPFFHMSGSEFVEMFVGVGASRVRDLFNRAKKSSPCIVFIDEIDAVGRQRGAGLGGSHDEREQTLNQILVEMDGFETDTNVIVIAATNRPDVLDPALLRPGRFDRRVIIDMPDMKDRLAILQVHAKEKPLAKEADLNLVAQRTPGFSGADLANLLNEAAILAARKNKKKIENSDLFDAIEKVMLGPERKSHVLSDKEKKITAYHEAGHALVSHLLPHADPVQKVSIISRGRAAGYTINLPEEDKHLHARSEFIDNLAVLLAGHATEKEIFGEVTTGASNDLNRATKLAKELITQYGMSDNLGSRTFGETEELIFLGRQIHEQRDYSEKVAEAIDKEISRLISDASKTAYKLITINRKKLDLIVQKLLEKETLEKEEFAAIFQD